MKIYVICFAILISLYQVSAANWALLVAGSNGYWNYRHQSDVCHAYQILHKLGMPDDHIVTMMFDDIANNSANPIPGNIINVPNGPNVYEGVLKDYTGEDVQPQYFLNILSGNATGMHGIGSGKVIASTSEDRIFVFFSDHGATDLIAFPESYLYADDFIATLQSMAHNNQYKEMVIYIEACESGSMFNGLLPNNTHIYATSAANPFESSYACYYDNYRQAYLGDCYSVNWMVNTETSNVNTETFETQYNIIQQDTNTSHVCQYGQLPIDSEFLSAFFNEHNEVLSTETVTGDRDPVDQRDVEIHLLYKKMKVASRSERRVLKAQIRQILDKRFRTDRLFEAIGTQLIGQNYHAALGIDTAQNGDLDSDSPSCYSESAVTKDFGCYKSVIAGIEGACGRFDHYGLYYTMQLSRMCNYGVTADSMIAVASTFCATH